MACAKLPHSSTAGVGCARTAWGSASSHGATANAPTSTDCVEGCAPGWELGLGFGLRPGLRLSRVAGKGEGVPGEAPGAKGVAPGEGAEEGLRRRGAARTVVVASCQQ